MAMRGKPCTKETQAVPVGTLGHWGVEIFMVAPSSSFDVVVGNEKICVTVEEIKSIPKEYRDLRWVFSEEEANKLPPHRDTDCAIELIPGQEVPRAKLYSRGFIPKTYHRFMVLTFAFNEIRKNIQVFPNISIEYDVNDNMFNTMETSANLLERLSQTHGNYNHYNCYSKKAISAVIGALFTQNSIQIANVLTNYKIPQLSYGSFDPVLSDKIKFPFFNRLVPNEELQHTGIVQLLKHFGWTWVGLITSDDESGETFLQSLRPRLLQNSICIAFVQKMPMSLKRARNEINKGIYDSLRLNEVNVNLVHGDVLTMDLFRMILHLYESDDFLPMERVWLITAQWDFTTMIAGGSFPAQSFNGTLSFSLHTNVVPGLEDSLDHINPHYADFAYRFWETAFDCTLLTFERGKRKCTEREKLVSLPGSVFEKRVSGESYSVYNAVYAIAHALQALHSLTAKRAARGHQGKRKLGNIQPWQLNAFLRKVRFNNTAGDEIFFDEKGDLVTGHDIINTITFPNGSFQRIQVGMMDPQAPVGQEFSLNGSAIVWNPKFKQVVPFSKCVESCQPGSNKIVVEGKEICCYNCTRCPEGMISVQVDADQCQKCPEDQYPNEKQDQCIPRSLSFLSYGELLGAMLTSFASLSSLTTVMVMGLFILHWDTPIVKANNRSITCTLLTSLLLGFLSSLLFMGQPGKVICLLRQTVFGITSCLSVSCLLAKTITVVLVFMATQPGNSILKWAGKRLATSVIILSCLIQTSICTVWIITSPPFPELDLHSQISQITVQCNEGSEIMFYVVLGYMGLLAVISFIVAYLARRLPDSFNEAKLITFSMLLFCTVWVSFIPAYLSTKGRYMVAVEIFSILASGAGLLGCIFLPKCYIIVVRPQLNTREQLVQKKNGLT
ncbi:vomeronasal type-2 receptor 26-like [Heteronotia binoei]|uniref:vomeronasal type-2 receptor 26-like n=1 Tax=Heteronotia binoei TaxID=13085 RepID=UPI00292E04B5|nr:vomeronasal type-2 receptor 26-like [Heteronotia binoei]